MGLPEMMAADAAALSAMDGETVTFKPAGAPEVVVNALVHREEPEQNENRATFRGCTIFVPQSAIPRPVQGRDKFNLVLEVGKAARDVGCGEVQASDHGFWQVRVTS